MTKEEFDFMEVRPKEFGRYFVTLYNYKTESYLADWLEFMSGKWMYGEYAPDHYVCFIRDKD